MKTANILYYILYGILRCIAALPFWILYGLSDILSFIAHRVVRYRVGVVRSNLERAFPDMDLKERRTIEKRFYRHLGDVVVETIKLFHISDKSLKKRMHLTNPELLEEIEKESRSIILYLGHYGNWEWVPAITLSLGKDFRMGALYKPLQDAVMARLTMKLRSRLGIQLVPAAKAYRCLLEMKRKDIPFVMGFIADQRPVGVPLHHWTEFLGLPTAFLGGAETIGDRVGARYLYLDMEKTSRGHYSVTFKEITVNPSDHKEFPYTRKYFKMLEHTIKRAPAYWLWSHNRWKAKPPCDISL